MTSADNYYNNIRFIHAATNTPAVDIWVDEKVLVTNIQHKTASDYFKVSNDNHEIKIMRAGTDEDIFDFEIEPDIGECITVTIIGDMEDETLEIEILNDNEEKVPGGKSLIKLFNAAESLPNIDVYTDNEIAFIDAGYMNTTDYIEVNSGEEILLNMTEAGTDISLLDPIPIILESGKSYTLIISGIEGDLDYPLSMFLAKEQCVI